MPIVLTRNMPITSESLNDLRAASWEGPQRGGDWTSVFEHSLGWVCATDADSLIGFVNVAWDGDSHAFLLDTTVHRDYQRRGIGTALVREAASLAQENGAECLHVDYEENLESFYRGCGFRPTSAGLLNLAAGNSATAEAHDREVDHT